MPGAGHRPAEDRVAAALAWLGGRRFAGYAPGSRGLGALAAGSASGSPATGSSQSRFRVATHGSSTGSSQPVAVRRARHVVVLAALAGAGDARSRRPRSRRGVEAHVRGAPGPLTFSQPSSTVDHVVATEHHGVARRRRRPSRPGRRHLRGRSGSRRPRRRRGGPRPGRRAGGRRPRRRRGRHRPFRRGDGRCRRRRRPCRRRPRANTRSPALPMRQLVAALRADHHTCGPSRHRGAR